MTLATTLRTAARSLISTFGNIVTIYSYSSATKTENTEGDVTVNWNITSTETFNGDGAETAFTVANIPAVAITTVSEYIASAWVDTTAYTVDLTTGILTFTTAPIIGVANVRIIYTYNGSSDVQAVDGANAQAVLTQVTQGRETAGDDEKTFRDDATIVVNDRVTADGVDFRVTEVRPIRTQDTLVISIVKVARVKDTTNW